MNIAIISVYLNAFDVSHGIHIWAEVSGLSKRRGHCVNLKLLVPSWYYQRSLISYQTIIVNKLWNEVTRKRNRHKETHFEWIGHSSLTGSSSTS